MNILQLINAVLNPNCLPKDSSVYGYGEEELKKLAAYYGEELVIDDEKFAPVLNPERMTEDFEQFKIVLKSFRGKSLQDVCRDIINLYEDMFPDFAILAKITLVSPITSVACERGFSSQNRLKHKNRCNLKHETVNTLIRIMEEGPDCNTYDPVPSVKKFLRAKRRVR